MKDKAVEEFLAEKIRSVLENDPETPIYIQLNHKSARTFQDSLEQTETPQELVFEEKALRLDANNLDSIMSLLSVIRPLAKKPVFFVHDGEIIPEHEFIIDVDNSAQLRQLPRILHNARSDGLEFPYYRARLFILLGSLVGTQGMKVNVAQEKDESGRDCYPLVFDVCIKGRMGGFQRHERSALVAFETLGLGLRTGFPASKFYPVSIRVIDPEQNISLDYIPIVPLIRAVVIPPKEPDTP
jgi:hypothetical protein